MSKIVSKISFFVFFSMLVFSNIYCQDTYNLKYKYVKDKPYIYKANTSHKTDQELRGNVRTSTSEVKSEIRYIPSLIEGDKITFTYSFDSYNSKSEGGPGGNLTNNGEKEKNRKNNLITSSNGTYIDRQFIDSSYVRVPYATLIFNVICKLPDNQVKIGDAWKYSFKDRNHTEGGMTNIQSASEYKLEGKETCNGTECLKISYTATASYDGKRKARTNVDGDVFLPLSGKAKITGFYLYDIKRGIIIKHEGDFSTSEVIEYNESLSVNIDEKVKIAISLAE